MCVCLLQERDTKCFYGDKCRFLHDVSEYLSSKAQDLGDQCPLFNSFGWCQYGLTCRFSKAHTSPELKNLRNQDVCGRSTDTVTNLLDKDLQRRLRKKQERFPGAEAFLKSVGRGEKPAAPGADTADAAVPPVKTLGPITDADIIKLRPSEKKQVDFRDKLYLAPLTTVNSQCYSSCTVCKNPAHPVCVCVCGAVWEPAVQARVQALRSRHHVWRDGHVHEPAAGSDV